MDRPLQPAARRRPRRAAWSHRRGRGGKLHGRPERRGLQELRWAPPRRHRPCQSPSRPHRAGENPPHQPQVPADRRTAKRPPPLSRPRPRRTRRPCPGPRAPARRRAPPEGRRQCSDPWRRHGRPWRCSRGSKTRTHYGPVGSRRRTAGRRGGAGLGRTGRRWVDPAKKQPLPFATQQNENTVLNVSSEARTV